MEIVKHIGLSSLLVVACIIAIGLTTLRLPGIWLLLAVAAVFDWAHGWTKLGGKMLFLMLGAAIVAEILETILSAWMAKSAGAARQAMWGGIVGGFFGAVFLSFVIPIPFVGSVVGALLGCFLGAAIVEFLHKDQVYQGAKVGLFSVIGFAMGMVLKTAITLALCGVLLTAALCSPATPTILGN